MLSRSFKTHVSMITANRHAVMTKLTHKLALLISSRSYATEAKPKKESQLKSKRIEKNIQINSVAYKTDEWCNMTPRILSIIGRNLHLKKDHPICLIKDVIVNHFYKKYTKSRGAPLFVVQDSLLPVVSTNQNFDSVLVPKDHVSRQKSENYYINSTTLLRAHTTAHEVELIKSGLNAFLTVGDVYRRDTVDSCHYPAFHQLEGVRLFSRHELFSNAEGNETELPFLENGTETSDKQAGYSLEASKLVELGLKKTIEDCMEELFGKNMERRWIDAHFPFTHPSFELEIKYGGEWIEMLGCGVLRQEILKNAGAGEKIAWAFGLGLERLAMKLFNVPDIRYFWCEDESFLGQFRNHSSIRDIKFKPFISKQPALFNDIAFWIPQDYSSADFYDIIRNLAGDLVESVMKIDKFIHPISKRESHCYRLYYRHVSRPLTQTEIAGIHSAIKKAVTEELRAEGRW